MMLVLISISLIVIINVNMFYGFFVHISRTFLKIAMP